MAVPEGAKQLKCMCRRWPFIRLRTSYTADGQSSCEYHATIPGVQIEHTCTPLELLGYLRRPEIPILSKDRRKLGSKERAVDLHTLSSD